MADIHDRLLARCEELTSQLSLNDTDENAEPPTLSGGSPKASKPHPPRPLLSAGAQRTPLATPAGARRTPLAGSPSTCVDLLHDAIIHSSRKLPLTPAPKPEIKASPSPAGSAAGAPLSPPADDAGADASAPPADAVAGNIVARLNGEMRGVLERELLELLNEGTLDELQALAGIGPKRAQYIHERRAARGPFARIDELAGVGGLTAAQAAQLASKNMERLLAAAR